MFFYLLVSPECVIIPQCREQLNYDKLSGARQRLLAYYAQMKSQAGQLVYRKKLLYNNVIKWSSAKS